MKHTAQYNAQGFVFIELIVVLGILSTLLGIVIINVLNIRTSASINTIVSTFITDVKSQQTKAMVGDTEGRGVPDTYAVYVQPTKYTLIHGQNYSASDSANFNVSIDTAFQLTSTFPQNKIIFASGNGELVNFTTGNDSVTIQNVTTNEQKVIKFNQYGSIISVQ